MSATKSRHDYLRLAEREQFHQGNARTIAGKPARDSRTTIGENDGDRRILLYDFAEGITTSRLPGRRRTKYAPGDVRETLAARGAASRGAASRGETRTRLEDQTDPMATPPSPDHEKRTDEHHQE